MGGQRRVPAMMHGGAAAFTGLISGLFSGLISGRIATYAQ